MKRIGAIGLLLALLLTVLPFTGCLAKNAYRKEANTGQNAGVYPYLVRMPSATWYLAKDDIELLGEEAFYEGLYAILDDAEADMKDAREALSGYIADEIEPIDIYTDFTGKAEIAKAASAYYNGTGNFIKLFSGWETVRIAFLHEYVHYLTMHCAQPATRFGFWAEGMADYVANFLCRNRLGRSAEMGFDIAEYPPFLREQAWDASENSIDPRKLDIGLGALAAGGALIGRSYYAVMNDMIVRTEQMEADLKPNQLSLCEASGMIAYLTETYGRDTVFKNWDLDPDRMETVYGKSFSELYRDWAAWNRIQCESLGIKVGE